MNVTVFLTLCCAVLSFLFYYKKLCILSVLNDAVNYIWNARNELVLIVIVSSQDHFEQRQSLRNTWLTLANKYEIKHYFLIGKTVCPLHPEDRISTLECEEQIVSISDSSNEDTLFKVVSDDCSVNYQQCSIVGDGFTFIVHHDIVVHHLGIQATALLYSNSSVVRVVLVDSASHEKIASTTFYQTAQFSDEYLWKKVHTVILPAGFEGEISISGLSDELHWYNSSFKFSATNGCIHISEILKKNLSVKYSTINNCCSLASFSYTIKDINTLQSHIYSHSHRQQMWNISVKTVEEKLQEEAKDKQDILFMDMIDVYRNLPTKMLMFYEWLAKQNTVYQYILKTDDDTFIDIHKVVAELQKHEDWEWWSCFRIGWPVQRVGKWKEIQYNKNVYPPFPSGSGYVLIWNVIKTIAKHATNLEKRYQGEDVALGIWVEEFNFISHVGTHCYWACNENCHENTCNAAQLTTQDMYTVWNSFEEYGKIICPSR